MLEGGAGGLELGLLAVDGLLCLGNGGCEGRACGVCLGLVGRKLTGRSCELACLAGKGGKLGASGGEVGALGGELRAGVLELLGACNEVIELGAGRVELGELVLREKTCLLDAGYELVGARGHLRT